MSAYETYGSFWVDFLHDKRGKLIKADHLFFNVFDYWALIHVEEIVKCERCIIQKSLNWKDIFEKNENGAIFLKDFP